jgi:hypothetical protein
VTPAELLRREGAGLVDRLRLWTPARWSAAAPVLGARGDVVHHLAQRLADDAALLESRRARTLPRLDSDPALADQLAVTLDDLLRAGPSQDLARLTTAHLLLHRTHLLGDEVPPGLAAALGLDDVLASGREYCKADLP